MNARRETQSGFTIIELAIVMTVIFIICAIMLTIGIASNIVTH